MTSRNGRDDRGRFGPGNPGGPGRPRRETEAAYLTAVAAACPPEAWVEIAVKAVEDAKHGDAVARAWLASYLLGRPVAEAATLHELAVAEVAGDDEVALEAGERRQQNMLRRLSSAV